MAQTWSGSNVSTSTADPVVIHIPDHVANTVSTPHLSLQRDLPLMAVNNYVRQDYLSIYTYFPGLPPALPPTISYKLHLNDEGYLSLGYFDSKSPLKLKTPSIYNQRSMHFTAEGYIAPGQLFATSSFRQMCFVNRLHAETPTSAAYARIARTDDMGFIWSDGKTASANPVSYQTFNDAGEPTGSYTEAAYYNQSAGFVIAPWNNDATAFKGLRMDADGHVGIGTYTTFGKTLAVNGTITCKEIDMDRSADSWPDYVFAPGYGLLTLEQLQAYTDSLHHLPAFPAADTVATQGMHLTETVVQLLKTQEELTLYLFQLNERLKALEAENAKLRRR